MSEKDKVAILVDEATIEVIEFLRELLKSGNSEERMFAASELRSLRFEVIRERFLF